MDELQLIREFRGGMPQASADVKRQARELLARQFDRRSRLVRRRRVLVWVAVALVAGLLAGSAFAFGDRILDFVRGQPATKPVKHQFRFDFGPRPGAFPNDSDVIMSRLHGVLAFKTQQGTVALWAAPTRRGGTCFTFRKLRPRTLQEKLGGPSGCFPARDAGRPPLVATIEDSSDRPAFAWGLASKNIVRVEVHLVSDDGFHRKIVRRANVYEHYFAVGVPAVSTLDHVVGLDASGRKVATYRQPGPSTPKPVPPPARVGPFRKIFDARLRTGAITHRVVFSVAPGARGALCVDLSYTGQPGEIPYPNVTKHCVRPTKKPIELLGLGGGAPPEWGFLIGRANNGAASVALRFADGTSIPLRLTPDRFFIAFLSGRRTLPGHQAVALIAEDRAGRVLGKQTLEFFAP